MISCKRMLRLPRCTPFKYVRIMDFLDNACSTSVIAHVFSLSKRQQRTERATGTGSRGLAVYRASDLGSVVLDCKQCIALKPRARREFCVLNPPLTILVFFKIYSPAAKQFDTKPASARPCDSHSLPTQSSYQRRNTYAKRS